MPLQCIDAGKLPVFIIGKDPFEDILSVGPGDATAGAAGCGFGAEQAVLVRDEASKARLVAKYGQKMLILTVHECKGLEFQVPSPSGLGASAFCRGIHLHVLIPLGSSLLLIADGPGLRLSLHLASPAKVAADVWPPGRAREAVLPRPRS